MKNKSYNFTVYKLILIMKNSIEGFIKELTREWIDASTLSKNNVCTCSCGTAPSFAACCGTIKEMEIQPNLAQ